jgi:hypothetical protein
LLLLLVPEHIPVTTQDGNISRGGDASGSTGQQSLSSAHQLALMLVSRLLLH